ncbi:MAG: 4'-phosphopantetheinyl transferase superfamily protein [Clostridiales bacterium]|nr:4'-phosphopantetheinyl transferase superfamily protein [Clostridiales bacterium]
MSDFYIYIFHADNLMTEEERLYKSASHYSGLASSAFIKAQTEAGKPFFPSTPHIKFSISHSGDYWACAFGASEVGLDIQQHTACRSRDISKRFFHPEEIGHLEACEYAPETFFEIWTAKESYVKFTGKGLPQGLDTFSVMAPIERAEFRHIPFEDGYSMCICAEKIGKVLVYEEE